MVLDFSAEGGIQYSLKCINRSAKSWYFFIYQSTSNQQGNDIYSLAWMASPYKIGFQSFIMFVWSVDYCFVWFNTGELQAGVIPASGGWVPAALSTNNSTTFTIVDDTPTLSAPVSVVSPVGFFIKGGSTIPNSVFSTGIGMSDFATLIKQAYANTSQEFNANTSFWVAATTVQVVATEVISQDDISNAAEFAFPLNTYNLTATLAEDNLWTIS